MPVRPVLGAVAGLAAIALAACTPPTSASSGAPDAAAIVERGRYLVESVGMCGDCHTHRLPTGQLDATRALHGATISFVNIHPQPWAPVTPALAGLPANYTEEQSIRFLRDGVRPDGGRPRPPMPEYRFDEKDARAIAAYLKSLPKPPLSAPVP